MQRDGQPIGLHPLRIGFGGILKASRSPESVLVETSSSVVHGATVRAVVFAGLPLTSPKRGIGAFIQHFQGNIYPQCKKKLDKNSLISIKGGSEAIHCCVAGQDDEVHNH